MLLKELDPGNKVEIDVCFTKPRTLSTQIILSSTQYIDIKCHQPHSSLSVLPSTSRGMSVWS